MPWLIRQVTARASKRGTLVIDVSTSMKRARMLMTRRTTLMTRRTALMTLMTSPIHGTYEVKSERNASVFGMTASTFELGSCLFEIGSCVPREDRVCIRDDRVYLPG